MSAPSADRALLAFEIKSAQLPLVAFWPKTPDLAALAQALQAQYGDMPDFFDHDPLLIDLSSLNQVAASGDLPSLDFFALSELLRAHRLRPVAVKGALGPQRAGAEAAGLVCADDATSGRTRAAPTPPVEESAPPAPSAPAPSAAPGALVVDKPLRSGQQVYARGRDLVVMAMVNPGAEVIADGHIHVYAPLRGKAIAGARGWQEARIVSLAMEPELISIAGVYRTSETPLPADVHGKAAQVKLAPTAEGGKLVMQALA